jgi:hypothetical protein
LRKDRVRAFAAGRRVGDDANPMSARRLAARQVANVSEQSADWCAQDMHNAERRGHPAFTQYSLCRRRPIYSPNIGDQIS